MKHSQMCPKCRCPEVLYVPGVLDLGELGNNIYTGATAMTAAPVGRYLCCECGYVEEWLDNLEDIKKLKDRYEKPFRWGQ